MSSCLSNGRARRRETSLSGLRDLRELWKIGYEVYTSRADTLKTVICCHAATISIFPQPLGHYHPYQHQPHLPPTSSLFLEISFTFLSVHTKLESAETRVQFSYMQGVQQPRPQTSSDMRDACSITQYAILKVISAGVGFGSGTETSVVLGLRLDLCVVTCRR